MVESIFDKLINISQHNALYSMDLPSGKYEFFSDSIENIFGYTPQEFYDKPLLIKTIIDNNYIEYFEQEWLKLLTGRGSTTYDYVIRHKDGSKRWIYQENLIVYDEEGIATNIKGIITDVTENILVRQNLEQSERKFKNIFNLSPDPILIILNERVVDCNDAALEMIQAPSKKEFIGTDFISLSPKHQPDGEETIVKIQKLSAKIFKEKVGRFEWLHKRYDGSNLLVEVTATLFELNGLKYIHVHWSDINGLKERELQLVEKLKKQNYNLDQAQKLANIGHWELDLINNELYWSDEVYRIFGLEPQAFGATYEAFLEHIHPDDHDMVNNAYTKSVERKIPYQISHRVITEQGEIKYVEERCSHELNSKGEVIGSIGTVHDITRQMKYEKELELSSNVFKFSTDAILITNHENKIVAANRAFEELSGYKEEEIIGVNPKVHSSGWGDEDFYKKMWNDIGTKGMWKGELWDRRKNGDLYAIAQTIIRIDDIHGNVQNYIGISHDITDMKEKEKRIQQLADYDFLTKLPNRKLFREEVESYIKSSHYHDLHFAFLFLDLDNFKWVNDSLGHTVGDKLLIQLSKLIVAHLPEDALLARLGGDEFVILMPYRELLSVSQLATQIIETVKYPILVERTEVNVGWSIGISLFPENGSHYDELLQNADTAMYQAKENGKNNFQYFSSEMNTAAKRRLQIDTRLRYAVEEEEFSLMYQPKQSCETSKASGFEALIRWNDSKLGPVSPDEFITIAEQSGMIYEIGLWVMKQALHDLKELHAKTKINYTMAINVSVKQLEDTRFYHDVMQLIRDSGVDASFLEFEITETAVMQSVEVMITTLKRFKELGIILSIDDFGTGYSSMSYLKKLPIDFIKIDQAFTASIERDEEDQAIVEAMIALSNALGFKTIAEGVESADALKYLEGVGCDYIQGYHYSKPLVCEDLVVFLEAELS